MDASHSMDSLNMILSDDSGKGRNHELKADGGDVSCPAKLTSKTNSHSTDEAIDPGAVNFSRSHEIAGDPQDGDDINTTEDYGNMDLYFRRRSESPDVLRCTGRSSTLISSYDGLDNSQQHHDTAPTSPTHRFELSYEIEDSRDEVRSENGGIRSRGRSVRGRGRGGTRPCSGSTTPLTNSPLVSAEKKRSGSGFDSYMSRRGRGSKRGKAYGLSRVGESIESETNGYVATSVSDDVYEFRSSPESEFTPVQQEYGSRDEGERSVPPSAKRQRLVETRPESHGGSAHSGDMEMDDIEDDEGTKPTISDRKVPPLRISLPITQSEEDVHGEVTGHQLALSHLSNANRKGPRGRHGKRQNDPDEAQRMTRSKVRQTGKVLDDTDAWAKKKRGRVNTTLNVTGDEADESTADDTSPGGEGFEDTSPTGQASNSNSVPESLSSEQRIIYENPRSGMYHLKKLLAERWVADLRQQHEKHKGENEKYKNMLLLTGEYSFRRLNDGSSGNQPVMEKAECKNEHPFPHDVDCHSPLANGEAESENEGNGICSEMKFMWKEHNEERANMMNRMYKERVKLQLFWEQELLRMEQRERCSTSSMSAVRFLRENEMCNAQILEESIELPKPMSRDEFMERKNKSINQMYNRHKMEASSLFGLQRDMWWCEARRRGLDINPKFIRDCVPLVKVEKMDFPY